MKRNNTPLVSVAQEGASISDAQNDSSSIDSGYQASSEVEFEWYISSDEECTIVAEILDYLWNGYPSDETSDLTLPNQSGEEQRNVGYSTNFTQDQTVKIQNVKFSDQHSGYAAMIKPARDSDRGVTDTKDTDLSDFFSRPVLISSIDWAVGGSINSLILPWQSYFANPRVENRITNYALMRADLHIKIVINGNGFYYGRAFGIYHPFSNFDQASIFLSNVDLVQFSQMPKVILDPTTSTGGEMVIPYHWFENNCQVDSRSFDELGAFRLVSYSDLQHANSGTDPITISIFAWAENVELAALTSNDISGLTPQSGTEVDIANRTGVVSGPATAISKMAGALSGVPYIGPYATATSIVGSTIAKVASMFGYCRPTVSKTPERIKPDATASLCVTNAPDTANKLTVDSKQELTIDNAAMGVGDTDPLDIATIARTESYFITFPWRIGTSRDSMLMNMRVDPCVFRDIASANATTGYLMPASCAASLPFRYWTGSIKLRFQFICSAFHKGRVRIVYDPRQLPSTGLTFAEYNINYQKVVDLAEERDVSITIGPAQTKPLMEHFRPGTDLFSTTYSENSILNFSDRGNGVVGVYVVNELSNPSGDINDIEVAVFVSACDDFEVFVPDPYFMRFTAAPTTLPLPPQAGAEMVPDVSSSAQHADSVGAREDGIGQSSAVTPIGYQYELDPKLNLMFTGESIRSFRSMLKRYNRWYTAGLADGNINDSLYVRFCAYPFLRGSVPGSFTVNSLGNGYNFCNTVLIHWVTLMFSGFRGSIRYKCLPNGPATGSTTIECSRMPNDDTINSFSSTVLTTPSGSAVGIASSRVYNPFNTNYPCRDLASTTGYEGAAYATGIVNNALEVEVPYYNNRRFVPGKRLNWTEDDGVSATSYDMVQWNISHGGNSKINFSFWVAVGEDFTTYFFTGLPRMYFESIDVPGF